MVAWLADEKCRSWWPQNEIGLWFLIWSMQKKGNGDWPCANERDATKTNLTIEILIHDY